MIRKEHAGDPSTPSFLAEILTLLTIDVCEVFLKAMMNPFQGMEDGINSKGFDDRVRAIARRYLS